MEFTCGSMKEGMCSTRNYGLNQYEHPCYHCCFQCEHAIKMDCVGVCTKVAEYYHPEGEQKCRVCGCTWYTPCEGGCYWVEEDLCSKCAEKITNEATKNNSLRDFITKLEELEGHYMQTGGNYDL